VATARKMRLSDKEVPGQKKRGGWYQDHPVDPLTRWQFAKWMAIEFVAKKR
jgi:hypothetical protein